MNSIKYVDAKTINEIGDEICVFGTGIEAEQLIDAIKETKINIAYFIDNNRSGNHFIGKEIKSLNFYVESGDNKPIVIATYKYANEIIKQIQKFDLDCIVWDDQNVFHSNETIERFVAFNKKIWESKKIVSDAKVLVPYDNKHSSYMMIHTAFCANYFAQKYNASIEAYFRFGGGIENVSDVVYGVYESINIQNVIDNRLSVEQKKRAKDLVEEIWQRIHTWKDWDSIEIYDINIGTTIVRHMLRHFMPSFEATDVKNKSFLNDAVETFVFWYDYIKCNNIKVVLLADGVCWDSYIRDIAITFGIDAYTIYEYFQKTFFNYYRASELFYLKDFWNQLTDEEQNKGIEWAKKSLDERINGKIEKLQFSEDKNIYSLKEKESGIKKTNKLKVLICPHIFEEDSYKCGEYLFDNNYLSWLNHIGELSERRTDVEWYLKIHPSASKRDHMIIEQYLEKYSNIVKIDKDVSPKQLKEEGVSWALTVNGTIAQEYPLIGIEVINAGHNVGETFDFAWNPKSEVEFDEIIEKMDVLQPKNNIEEIYKFYATFYYYYLDKVYINSNIFFDNIKLEWGRLILKSHGLNFGPWQYQAYMDEWTEEKQNRIEEYMPTLFNELDNWDAGIFYRKDKQEVK